MKRQLVYRIWWLTLLMWGSIFAGQSIAQTITVGTVSVPACMAGGSIVSVPFSVSGTFNSGNQFTVQVINTATSYTGLAAVVSTTTGSTISATIPANIPVASGYVIRVVSSSPARTSGNTSPAFSIIPPAPAVGISSPASGPICPNTTASLTATGSNIRWYSGAGTFLSAVNPYSPPTAQAGSSSYQASQTVSGCEGPRGTVVVTVTAKSPQPTATPPAYCQGVAGQPVTAYVSGSNLKWYIAANIPAPNNIPDPVMVSSAGQRTYFVTQTNNGCESDLLTFFVTVNAKPNPPTASSPTVCQNAGQQTLSANGQSGATFQWYNASDVLLGNNGAAPSPATTTPGSTTFKVDQTALGCRSDRATVTFTVRTAPAAPAVSTPVIFCQNYGAPQLNATPLGGAALLWYGQNATGGSATGTATTPANNASGTFNYYVSQTLNGCESLRSRIDVVIKRTPGAPTVITPVAFCQNSSSPVLNATPENGAALLWYGSSATGGTATSNAPIPPNNIATSYSYYVSQSLDGCESPQRAKIDVTVSRNPSAPSVAPIVFCQSTTAPALTASGENGSTFRWYGQNATGGSASSNASIVANNVAGNFTYYVSQVVNSCESSRAGLAVRVKAKPDTPSVTPVTYCLAQQDQPSQTASSLTAVGQNLRWFNSDGNIFPNAPTPPINEVRTINFLVSQTIEDCESDKATLRVTIQTTPTPTISNSMVSYCQNSQAVPLTATPEAGGSLRWIDPLGVVTNNAPTPITLNTTKPGGENFYVFQVGTNGCYSARNTIVLLIKPRPDVPAVVKPDAFCQFTSAPSLTAISTPGASLLWYGQNATGGSATGTATTPANNASGTFNYYVSQTLNGCESQTRAKIDVVVKRTPGAPNVITPVVFCQNSSAPILNAMPENGAALLWYGQNATGGTGGSNAPNPPNNVATSYNYYASQSLDGCESQQRARIEVTVKRTPSAPGVTPVAFCQFTTAPTLSASGENGATLRWYGQSATGGQASGNAPGVPNDVAGNFSYYVSQSVSDCESPRASLTVRVKAKPGAPGTNALTYCLSQEDQPGQSIGPLTANGQNLRWFNTDGNSFPNAPTPPIDRVQVMNFLVSQTIEDCESDRATLRVTVQTTATPSVSSSLVTYCQTTQSVPLTATAETGGSLRWVDPSGVITNNAPTPITLNATKPGGEFFYVFQVGANGCYSARNTIRLIVNSTPTLSLLGSTTVNLGLKANLQLRFTGVPPYSYALTDGTNVIDSGIAPDTLATVAVMPARTTTYQVASVTNVCGRGLPGNPATATVSVAIPVITTGTLASSALCAGASFSVPFSVAGTLNVGNVFQVQVADTLSKVFVPVSATTTATGPIVASLPASLTAGYYFVRVTGSNPGIAVAGQNSPVVLLVRGLPTARLSGNQDVYQGSSAKLSVAFTGDAPWTFVWADSTARNSVSTAANPHLIDVTPARTRSYSLISVANNCGNGTVSGTATLTILPLLAVDDPLAESVKVYPVPTGTTLTVEIDRNLLTAPATLQLTDITGRATLDRTTQDRRTDLDLSQQPAGLYLLRVQVGGQTTVRRVLKL